MFNNLIACAYIGELRVQSPGGIVLYCIVSIHLYCASCSAHQSEALPVRDTQREESSLESSVATQKKVENTRLGNKKPKKTQGQISIRFRKIFGKNRTFPEKKQTFPEKINFLMTFFLVIASDFQIFYPDFSNFDHFSPKMSYFLQKTTKKMYFRANFKKTKKNPRSFRKP